MADDADRAEHPTATTVQGRAPHERGRAPWWYYLLLGALAGSAIVVMLLAPGIAGSIAVLMLVLTNAGLQELRRRISGDPPRAWSGRALPYTVSGIVLCLGAIALGWYLVIGLGITWTAWVIGALVFAVIAVGGWLGER